MTNNQILIKECVKQEFEDSTEYESEASFFEFFAASQILKDYGLSDDEISAGIVGAGNDGGCDGIYTFLNNSLITDDQINTVSGVRDANIEFVIIQAKRETSFKEDALMKWKTTTNNLLQLSNSLEDYSARYNEDVLNSFRLFRDLHTKLIRCRRNIEFRFIYVTYADEVHPNVKQQAEELKVEVNRNFPSATVRVEFIGADELFKLYYSESEVRLDIKLTENPIALGRDKGFVALVALPEYYRFITDERGMLRKHFFEANVRDYQGANAVNSSIQESLQNKQDEEFWWLNNGVTILASEAVMVSGKELQLTNPEVVNGLQTSNEVYLYFQRNGGHLDIEKRNILVRIIVPQSEATRDSIIFATNNQTNIPKSSLRVTDPIHLQIEMYFKSRGLYYDRRKNYYKNQGKNAKDIIGVSFLGQCLITIFLKKPDFARARPSTLLTEDDTYNLLYPENRELEVFYRCARIGKKVRRNIWSIEEYSATEKSDILFYVLYGVVAEASNKITITDSDIMNINIDALTDDAIDNVRVKVFNAYKAAGGNSHIAKSPDFISEIEKILNIDALQ